MSQSSESIMLVKAVAKADGRYHVDAYLFVLEALNVVLERRRRQGAQGHVDGGQVLDGVKELGLEKFGYLAAVVLESWGVRTPRQVGDLIFNLVEADILSKQESDRREDFAQPWTFEDFFESHVLPGKS